MRSTHYHPWILALLFFPTVFLLGLYFDRLGLKIVAFGVMAMVIYLVLMTPVKWALFSLFMYVGLEGFFKVVSNYHPVIHVGSDIIVMTLVLKVLVQIFFQGLPSGDFPPLTRLFLVHFLWLLIILFNPYSLSLLSSIAGAKIYISMFLLYFYGYYMVNNLKDLRFYMIPFIIVAVIHLLTGIMQGLTGPAGLLALHPRYAVQLMKYKDVAFRPFGMTNLPGGPAVYMYQVFPFVLYFIFHFRSYFLRLALAAYLPLSTFLFILCQVRSALLKMIVASSLFLIGVLHAYSQSSYRSFQRIVIGVTAFGFVLWSVLPYFMEYSVEARQENEAAIERSLTLFDYDKVSMARRGTWDRFVAYAQEVPFGAGFARVGAAAGAFKDLHKQDPIFGYKHFFTDNLWLATLVEVGIPGMLIISLLVFAILICSYRNYFNCQDTEIKLAYVSLLAPLTALFLGLYGAEGLIYNPEACFFWFFSGVLMKLPELEKISS